jgi:hypothetical protein
MIIGQKFSTSLFFFDKKSNNFSQDISSLGSGAIRDLIGSLYNDASDEGFVMVSNRTGNAVPFYLTAIDKSDEGEVQCWNFKSAATANTPHLQNLTVTVFND